MEVISGLVVPAIANRSRDRRVILMALLILIIAGFCGLILSPQTYSLLWPCLLGLGIGGLFPMSLIVSLDHLDNSATRRRPDRLRAGHWLSDRRPLTANGWSDPRPTRQLRMGLVVADGCDGGDAVDGVALRSQALRPTLSLVEIKASGHFSAVLSATSCS